jgi:hypothetical protein
MRKINFIIIVFFIFSFNAVSNAQQKCGFDDIREQQLQDPNFANLVQQTERRIQEAMSKPDSFSRNGLTNVLTIPVVVHVLHLGEAVGNGTNISNAQIQSSIDNLNDYYRGQIATSPVDFEIEFALAQRDPNCNTSNGINRIDASGVSGYSANGVSLQGSGADETTLKDLSRWPETDYLNIWIVTEIDGNNGGSGIQGYADFYFGNSYEGSVMMYTVFGYDPTNANPSWPLHSSRDNSTVVHEAGHYFHLYHTFQGDGSGGSCPGDNTIGTDSDGCADTVPHKRETSTCPANNDCTGSPWVDNNTINNIMSYYNCTDRLTNDQKTRVRAAMEGTAIVSSKVSEPIDLTYVAPATACSTNSATTVDSNYAGILNVELNGSSYPSSSTRSDGGNIDNSSNCNSYFEIDATVSNSMNVTMYTNNWQQFGVWIDWNDDGDFDDDSEQQHLSNDIAANTVVTVPLIYPTTIPYNDYVRVRLITELDDRYGPGLIDSACYSSLVYGQSEDYTIYINPGVTTYTYNNGWLPSDPNGVATISDTVIIDAGTANISSDTNCDTITVNPGAALTIDSGVTVTVTTLDLNSTSQLFSSLVSDGTITGTVNYNRYVNVIGSTSTPGGNDLISVPLMPASGINFEELTLQGSPANDTKLAMNSAQTLFAFGPYDNTANMQYINYPTYNGNLPPSPAGSDFSEDLGSLNLVQGKGYRAATTIGETLTFSGEVETGTVNVGVSTPTGGSQWNLIGNPYPSYIDASSFLMSTANTAVLDGSGTAIYAYNSNAYSGNAQTIGNFTIINLATLTLPGETFNIAPGQGFFVASGAGGNVEFTAGMRTTSGEDDYILGRDSHESQFLKLDLMGSSAYSTSIFFNSNATLGLDQGYDAIVYDNNAINYPFYTHLAQENTGLAMAIQTLPYVDFNDIIVPLGINAQANEELTISINTVSTLPSEINVYLEDTFEDALTLLNTNDFLFTSPTELEGTGRFYLRFTANTLSIEDNNFNDLHIYATAIPKELVINGLLMTKTEANVFDIQGRLVLKTNLDTINTINSIDVSTLSTGVYIVKVSNDNQVKTQKVIIE